MQQIIINQSRLNFIDTGSGPSLLLIHGFPLDHSMWRHQIEPLSKHFRLICPDLPGFGSSETSTRTVSLLEVANDLASLLDALKIETVTFCGLSMGGYIGWQFWKQHPERLERLIACDTRAAADNETTARGRRVNAHAIRENGIGNLADEMIPKLFSPESLSKRPDDVNLIRRVISDSSPEIVAQAQLAMAERLDAIKWLSEITIPTLFLCGADDSITPPAEMRANCELVPAASFVEIAHAGHLSPLENPTAFNEAVLEFLS